MKERMNKPVRGFLRPKLPKRFSWAFCPHTCVNRWHKRHVTDANNAKPPWHRRGRLPAVISPFAVFFALESITLCKLKQDSSYRERFQASFYCTYYFDYVLNTERLSQLLLMSRLHEIRGLGQCLEQTYLQTASSSAILL